MKYPVLFLAGVAVLLTSYTCMAQRRFMRATPVEAPAKVQKVVENAVQNAVPTDVKADVEKVSTEVEAQVKKMKDAEGAVAQAKANEVVADAAAVKPFPGTDDQWKDSLDVKWIEKEATSHKVPAHFNNKFVLRGDQRDGHAYGRYTEADVRLWESETMRLVMEGSRIFHDADLLGSTNGTSCDMCHPDGMGTHPETYPKYQVQLGRAALLRDMMNWCLQNPCRAEPMSGDDPRMRAMEAYLNATSSGKPMKYGKH
ncbi:MAG: hypothetical protein Q4C70_04910 [Planctomycetia bacterium]|nr:hypothetical protein [Planctomycetia bacterium]